MKVRFLLNCYFFSDLATHVQGDLRSDCFIHFTFIAKILAINRLPSWTHHHILFAVSNSVWFFSGKKLIALVQWGRGRGVSSRSPSCRSCSRTVTSSVLSLLASSDPVTNEVCFFSQILHLGAMQYCTIWSVRGC
jgi:hypothetical protein